jgi:hypothetical protein
MTRKKQFDSYEQNEYASDEDLKKQESQGDGKIPAPTLEHNRSENDE